jgi:probable blue pigment (indigoidine) exporter
MAAYAYLSLFGTVLAYTLWFRGVAKLSPVAVSALGLISPLTAVVLGWGLLGERLSLSDLAAMSVVLASVLAFQWQLRPQAPIRVTAKAL